MSPSGTNTRGMDRVARAISELLLGIRPFRCRTCAKRLYRLDVWEADGRWLHVKNPAWPLNFGFNGCGPVEEIQGGDKI